MLALVGGRRRGGGARVGTRRALPPRGSATLLLLLLGSPIQQLQQRRFHRQHTELRKERIDIEVEGGKVGTGDGMLSLYIAARTSRT